LLISEATRQLQWCTCKCQTRCHLSYWRGGMLYSLVFCILMTWITLL